MVGDARRLPFADGSFDAVLAAWLLDALADVEAAALELHRVLRPDGQLLVITTTGPPESSRARHWVLQTVVREPLGRPLPRATVLDLPGFVLVAGHTTSGGLVGVLRFEPTKAGCCAQPPAGP